MTCTSPLCLAAPDMEEALAEFLDACKGAYLAARIPVEPWLKAHAALRKARGE